MREAISMHSESRSDTSRWSSSTATRTSSRSSPREAMLTHCSLMMDSWCSSFKSRSSIWNIGARSRYVSRGSGWGGATSASPTTGSSSFNAVACSPTQFQNGEGCSRPRGGTGGGCDSGGGVGAGGGFRPSGTRAVSFTVSSPTTSIRARSPTSPSSASGSPSTSTPSPFSPRPVAFRRFFPCLFCPFFHLL